MLKTYWPSKWMTTSTSSNTSTPSLSTDFSSESTSVYTSLPTHIDTAVKTKSTGPIASDENEGLSTTTIYYYPPASGSEELLDIQAMKRPGFLPAAASSAPEIHSRDTGSAVGCGSGEISIVDSEGRDPTRRSSAMTWSQYNEIKSRHHSQILPRQDSLQSLQKLDDVFPGQKKRKPSSVLGHSVMPVEPLSLDEPAAVQPPLKSGGQQQLQLSVAEPQPPLPAPPSSSSSSSSKPPRPSRPFSAPANNYSRPTHAPLTRGLQRGATCPQLVDHHPPSAPAPPGTDKPTYEELVKVVDSLTGTVEDLSRKIELMAGRERNDQLATCASPLLAPIVLQSTVKDMKGQPAKQPTIPEPVKFIGTKDQPHSNMFKQKLRNNRAMLAQKLPPPPQDPLPQAPVSCTETPRPSGRPRCPSNPLPPRNASMTVAGTWPNSHPTDTTLPMLNPSNQDLLSPVSALFRVPPNTPKTGPPTRWSSLAHSSSLSSEQAARASIQAARSTIQSKILIPKVPSMIPGVVKPLAITAPNPSTSSTSRSIQREWRHTRQMGLDHEIGELVQMLEAELAKNAQERDDEDESPSDDEEDSSSLARSLPPPPAPPPLPCSSIARSLTIHLPPPTHPPPPPPQRMRSLSHTPM